MPPFYIYNEDGNYSEEMSMYIMDNHFVDTLVNVVMEVYIQDTRQ